MKHSEQFPYGTYQAAWDKFIQPAIICPNNSVLSILAGCGSPKSNQRSIQLELPGIQSGTLCMLSASSSTAPPIMASLYAVLTAF